VRRRYDKGLRNFFGLYMALADSWQFFDNSATGVPRPVAAGEGDSIRVLGDADAWRRIAESYHG
jgi:predicted ABC-type ATPase